jgi:hypothetical protein
MNDQKTLFIEGEPSTANKIVDNLWIGSAPPMMYAISQYFNALILCAKEYQPDDECFFDVCTYHAPLHDNPLFITSSEKIIAVRAAGRIIHWTNEGKQILVTCLAGMNRSALIIAIALCTGPWKMSVRNAITAIRVARGQRALRNPQFISFLSHYCERK